MNTPGTPESGIQAPVSANLFDQALEPLPRAEFLAQHWSREYLHLRGAVDRFARLFSWQDLNVILARSPFERERFRLYQGGKEIEQSRYTQSTSLGPRLLAGPITNLLAGGATLILNSAHVHSQALTALTVAFEAALGAETFVNVYACWREQHAFDLHWDLQEVMVLQAAGRKRWRVFRPTFDHPLADDRKKVLQPTGEPVWDGVLEQGDVLYLPRGWWHQALPLNEPSLHLTVTIVPPTAADFLHWLTQKVKESPEGRANVPLAEAKENSSEFMRALRERTAAYLGPAALEDFLAQWYSSLTSRQGFELPGRRGALDGRLRLEGAQVQLATLARLVLVKQGKAAWFYANGVRWECPLAAASAIEALNGATPVQVDTLLGSEADTHVRRQLHSLLGALQLAGVVKITAATDQR
jgi:ribosomal protein L16 Arg81 hydroxylase